MKYCEVSINISDRNHIIPVTEIPRFIKNNSQHSLYRSVWLYDDDILKHRMLRKTVSGFKGAYYIDKLIFDIDTKGKEYIVVRGIIDDVIDTMRDQFSVPMEAIRIWFSGTGFHITAPDFFGFQPGPLLPKAVRATLHKYFPNTDDTIYIPTGLIRLSNTINQKSQLYKIPLEPEEFQRMTLEEIRVLAEKPRRLKSDKVTGLKKHQHLIIVPTEQEKKFELPADDSGRIVTCMQKLYNQGPSVGSRHIEGLRLVSSWRRGGISEKGAIALLTDWLEGETISDYEIKHIVHSVYEKAYTYSCKDVVFEKYCDSRCVYYKNKNYAVQVDSMDDIAGQYAQYLKLKKSGGAFDLGELFDAPPYRFVPQELVIFIGDTKVGKTAIVQNICVALKHMRILYMSLEVGAPQLFRRFVQIAYGLDKEDADKALLEDPRAYTEALSHIRVVTTPPKLDDVVKIISQTDAQLVVVDTMDGIVVDGAREETAITREVALMLKELANRLSIIIIGVHHISKFAVAKTDKLTKHSGKGSSAMEQKADKLIAIEPFNGNQRILRTLASRDEHDITIPFDFDGNTFRFTRVYPKQIGFNNEEEPIATIDPSGVLVPRFT